VTPGEARDFLEGLVDYERAVPRSYDKATFGLERMRHLCDALGRPQLRYATVQVGGTNGKGGVCAFAESICRHAGLRIGLTTSPHLIGLRERIAIDGRFADDDLFSEAVSRVAEAVLRLPDDERTTVTFFEAITASAFVAFALAEVDVGVVEVGLGGWFDATSVTQPRCVVVTSVGRDHQAFLGETVEEIAADKAHLIRDGVPVVLGCTEPALSIMLRRAEEQGCPAHVLGRDFGPVDSDLLAAPSEVQTRNAACAIEAVRIALPEVGDKAVRDGLAGARWPGRFQVLEAAPTVVLDCAMNPESAEELGRELSRRFPGARIALVFGMSADKRPALFMERLAAALSLALPQRGRELPAPALGGRAGLGGEVPALTSIFACSAATPRSLQSHDLAEALAPLGVPVTDAGPVAEALALAGPSGADVVCVTGSVYVVGEAMRALGISPELS